MQPGKILLGFVAIMLSVVLAAFLIKDKLLSYAFEKVKHKTLTKYNLILNADSINYSGLNAVSVSNLSLSPVDADTLIAAKKVRVKFSLSSLLIGNIKLNDVEIDSLRITINNLPNQSNLSFLKHSNNSESVDKTQKDSKPIYKRVLAKLEDIANTSLSLHNTVVSYMDSSNNEQIFFPEFISGHNKFQTSIVDLSIADTLNFSGELLPNQQEVKFSFFKRDTSVFEFPFVESFDGLKFGFTSMNATLAWAENENNITLHTTVDSRNLLLNHWRLASEPIVFPSLNIKSKVLLQPTGFTVDSSTSIKVNDLPLQLFAHYEKHDTDKILSLKFDMPEVAANTFFSALPRGVFTSMQGINCSGKLAYSLNLKVNTRELDSLVFESEMRNIKLAVQKFGAEDFTRIQNDFVHNAYAKGVLARHINVSPGNPDFVPLSRISSYLIASVLQAEDPSFMRHNGFLPSAFRESVIKNLREKRFARGGSTISMQLVKNVFLSQDKNIARKAEEALIVYLIENLNLVSKERMLETYLNIIEWGPNVFGIGEASRFYFNKKPIELSLQESIFLAGIISNPRVFKYHFESDGALKPHFAKFYEVLINRMVDRGSIQASDTFHVMNPIVFKGAAKKAIMPIEEEIEDLF